MGKWVTSLGRIWRASIPDSGGPVPTLVLAAQLSPILATAKASGAEAAGQAGAEPQGARPMEKAQAAEQLFFQ